MTPEVLKLMESGVNQDIWYFISQNPELMKDPRVMRRIKSAFRRRKEGR